jgi:ActR/RegA family two-component response regulator
MYIQFTGFKVAADSRIYSFHVLDATREAREFTVRIESDTNHWTSLKLQDGPGICFERLEKELSRETAASSTEDNLCISEQDIREYLARHNPPAKTFGRKEWSEHSPEHDAAPTVAHSTGPWRGLSEPGGNPPKLEITALLLHSPGEPLALLKAALESQSIQIDWLRTVQEALPLLRAVNPPHLVFVEAKLPDGTWSDIVKETLKAQQPVKVVVVSRLADARLYVDAMEGGAVDFIVPPLTTDELTHVVKGAVRSVLDLRQAQSAIA